MIDLLERLRKKVVIGVVGGSDFNKIAEQLYVPGSSGAFIQIRTVDGFSPYPLYIVVDQFDYFFAENGLTAYKSGKQLSSQSFIQFVGEERYKKLVNFILHYLADLDIPIKRYVSC